MDFSFAARISLIIFSIAAVYGFLFDVLSEENFMILAGMVFAAFFANRV